MKKLVLCLVLCFSAVFGESKLNCDEIQNNFIEYHIKFLFNMDDLFSKYWDITNDYIIFLYENAFDEAKDYNFFENKRKELENELLSMQKESDKIVKKYKKEYNVFEKNEKCLNNFYLGERLKSVYQNFSFDETQKILNYIKNNCKIVNDNSKDFKNLAGDRLKEICSYENIKGIERKIREMELGIKSVY